IFLDSLGKRFSRQHILLILDGAPNHTTDDLLIPANVTLEFLPPCSPGLNPQDNIWDKIREKIFKNYALKSMDKVCDKLEEAALYIERNPTMVKSITSFPSVQRDVQMVSYPVSLREPACRSSSIRPSMTASQSSARPPTRLSLSAKSGIDALFMDDVYLTAQT